MAEHAMPPDELVSLIEDEDAAPEPIAEDGIGAMSEEGTDGGSHHL